MSKTVAGTEDVKDLNVYSAVVKKRTLPWMTMRGMPASNLLTKSFSLQTVLSALLSPTVLVRSVALGVVGSHLLLPGQSE